MQDALGIVIVAVVVVAGLVGVAAAFASRAPYERIGRSGFTFDGDAPSSDAGAGRDEEIAQLLAALGRTAPPRDPTLEAEVRAAVEARNARLIARGREPLDVAAEVERRLSAQDG